MTFTFIFLIGAAICIPLLLSVLKKNNQNQNINYDNNTNNVNYFDYERKYLLTKNEWSFYKKLKPIADKYNLHVLSKIRLEDIIHVKDGLNKSMNYSARGRIKSRHIDFALANPDNLDIILAIELDDNSHNNQKAFESDMFKNQLFNTVGLPFIRVLGNEDIEYIICTSLNINMFQNNETKSTVWAYALGAFVL